MNECVCIVVLEGQRSRKAGVILNGLVHQQVYGICDFILALEKKKAISVDGADNESSPGVHKTALPPAIAKYSPTNSNKPQYISEKHGVVVPKRGSGRFVHLKAYLISGIFEKSKSKL